MDAHLFVFDNIRNRRLSILGHLGQPASIYHSLISDGHKNLYFGTMPAMDSLERTETPKNYQGGHLYRFSVASSLATNEEGADTTVFSMSELVDCGIPVPGHGIQCLLYSPQTNRIYGLTYPEVHLFYYDVSAGSFGKTTKVVITETPYYKDQFVARGLVSDANGNIYGTGEKGYFFRYGTADERVEFLPLQVPGMSVRQEWSTAESFCVTADGTIWGGTNDGYLFKFHPEEMSLINLGKPSLERRIRGLCVAGNGSIYGITGDCRGNSGIFRYDLKTGNYDDLGLLRYIPVEHNSEWTVYHLKSMVQDPYGCLYLGESDVTSHLFTFFPY
jgi:ligand-binding sensor domain-containing protein